MKNAVKIALVFFCLFIATSAKALCGQSIFEVPLMKYVCLTINDQSVPWNWVSMEQTVPAGQPIKFDAVVRFVGEPTPLSAYLDVRVGNVPFFHKNVTAADNFGFITYTTLAPGRYRISASGPGEAEVGFRGEFILHVK